MHNMLTHVRVVLRAQGRQELREGVGRGTEEEEDLDPIAARQFLSQPSKLLELDSPLVQKVRRSVLAPSMLCTCRHAALCHSPCRNALHNVPRMPSFLCMSMLRYDVLMRCSRNAIGAMRKDDWSALLLKCTYNMVIY